MKRNRSIQELLKGAFDLHMHTSPDLHERSVDDFEAALQAKEQGMAGILIKNHSAMTAGRAALVSKQTGFPVYGSITLNRATGGFDPEVLKSALAFGAKEVWMPTSDGSMHLKAEAIKKGGVETSGLPLIDKNGQLVEEIGPILDAIAESNVILGTGHISKEEAFLLIQKAKERGVKKIVITHPQADFMGYSEEDIVAAAKMGALIEHDYVFLTPAAKKLCERVLNPSEMASLIRKVGPDNSILATDSGQTSNPPPAQCMALLISVLMDCGIAADEIRVMTHENPKRLIELI